MVRTRWIRRGRSVAWVLLLIAFVGSIVVGQVRFRHPQPGDVYKEYSRTMMEYYLWRVTDPNATSIWIPDPSYLVNAVLPITIDDLEGAIRAEAVIDLWQGHSGTTGKKMKVNGHEWIYIPELKTTPGDGQCWLSQSDVVVNVPLDHLVQGTNYFEGSNEGQTCHSIDWGQHGMERDHLSHLLRFQQAASHRVDYLTRSWHQLWRRTSSRRHCKQRSRHPAGGLSRLL
jgi:hypothetical protein